MNKFDINKFEDANITKPDIWTIKKLIPKQNKSVIADLSKSSHEGLKYLYFINVMGYDTIYTISGDKV